MGVGAIVAIGAVAQTEEVISVLGSLSAREAKEVTTRPEFKLEDTSRFSVQVGLDQTLKAADKVMEAARKSIKAPAKAAALQNYYVGTYLTLSSSSFDGGSTMQVVPDAQGDSITIKYFWNGCDVRALYNKEAGKVTVPSQYVMTDTSLGALNLAIANTDGTPDYNKELTGTVSADGSIDFSSDWWGIFVAAGQYKDRFAAAYYNLVLEKPTGTMTYKTSTGEQNGYYVTITQSSKNMLKVKNIFNRGGEIEILLDRDRTATIKNQTGFVNASGTWVMIKCVSFNDAGNLTGYLTQIVTDKAAESNNNTLTWTDWSLLCAEASSYAGKLTDAVLTADTPWVYPSLAVSEFEGDGTEANPYKISSLDHLILLSDKVNSNQENPQQYYNNVVYRNYLGKHFELTRDIDMSGYRFDPIGRTYYYRFAGIFDGKGHTIKGLDVDGGTSYYSGLFGQCDTVSVLKNIVLDSPKVVSQGSAAAGLVAWTQGSVSDITVINPTINNTKQVAAGVAGVAVGSVANCNVSGGTIYGAGYVGGVAGEVHGGIRNCAVANTRIYNSGAGVPAGGVLGNLLDADGENLSFMGMVASYNQSDEQQLGGVAGLVQRVTLRKSFASGVVNNNGNDAEVGGVAGILTGRLEDCYSSGLVHCYSRMTGGLVGQAQSYRTVTDGPLYHPELKNCYTSATVEAETYQYNRENCSEVIGKIVDTCEPVITNVYYDNKVTNFNSTRFGVPTSELVSAQGPKGFSSDVWTFTQDAYPRIKDLADSEISKYASSAIVFASADNVKKISNNTKLTALGNTKYFIAKGQTLYTEGHYSKVANNNTLEIGTEFGPDTLYIVNGTTQSYKFINIAPIPFSGEGTEESPFLISGKSDMIALGEATTGKRQTFPGMYFKMTNDIDMELDDTFLGINTDYNNNAASIKFQGVFDGDGHTLKNLTIANRLVWSTPITDGKLGTLDASNCKGISGLFGRVGEDGVVKNLTIDAGAKLEMYAQCAAFVGTLDGVVENCRNYADVTGYSTWVGGIVGQMNKGSRVSNCYNAGNITSSYSNVAGISGSSAGTIENCVNTGDIKCISLITNYNKQRQRAGGILGSANGAIVRNCQNFGTVYAELNNCGGIAAAMEGSSSAGVAVDTMEGCLSLGNSYCGNQATLGAVLGVKGTKNIAGVYYDNQMIGLKAGANSDVDGITPLSTASLTSGEVLEGLPADAWDYKAGQYPALKLFADEAKVQAARKVTAKIADGETVADLKTDVTLGDGASWSLAKAESFKIEGSKLSVPASVETVVTDTLYALNAAGVRRPILISSMPVVPLTGAGTEADPYLITKWADYNNLSSYIKNTHDNFTGRYIKLTVDLSTNGTNLARLFNDGISGFEGVFDGDGHKISGLGLKTSDTQKSALFGTVAADGVIKNLTVEGTLTGSHTYAAPIVDKLYGTLSNVTSDFKITTTKTNGAGVAGYAYAGAKFDKVKFIGSIEASANNVAGIVSNTTAAEGSIVTFTDCEFLGKINHTVSNTKASAASIGGLVFSAASSKFENCRSAGEISVKTPEWTSTVGGFIATAPGAKAAPDYDFINCKNETSISAMGIISGFVAVSATTAANAVYRFVDCENTGDMSSESTKSTSSQYVSGFLNRYTPGSKFIRCVNKGTIISNKNVNAGGIACYNNGTITAANPVEFTDCRNEGAIIADGNQGGGIVAYVSGAVYLTNCANVADVTGNQMLGGITSCFAGSGPKMVNCYNTGNITGKQGRVGGLVACGAPTDGEITGCWNSGNVASTDTVKLNKQVNSYQIGGLAGQNGATFTNCYNVGTVKGLACVGGLVGETVKNKTILENCYNAGKIIADKDSCGSLVGNVLVNNGKVWNTSNSIKNCYYLNENVCDNDAQLADMAKGVTRAELAKLDLGEGFVSVDDYTHPVIKGFDNHEVALFHAAELVLNEKDTPEQVTKDFNVGAPASVIWSSDCDALQFSGNDAKFVKNYNGAITVTAKAGELSKEYKLTAAATTGVDGLDVDSDVVSCRYYAADGLEVAEPVKGEVYVRVEILTNGSTRTCKVRY